MCLHWVQKWTVIRGVWVVKPRECDVVSRITDAKTGGRPAKSFLPKFETHAL